MTILHHSTKASIDSKSLEVATQELRAIQPPTTPSTTAKPVVYQTELNSQRALKLLRSMTTQCAAP